MRMRWRAYHIWRCDVRFSSTTAHEHLHSGEHTSQLDFNLRSSEGMPSVTPAVYAARGATRAAEEGITPQLLLEGILRHAPRHMHMDKVPPMQSQVSHDITSLRWTGSSLTTPNTRGMYSTGSGMRVYLPCRAMMLPSCVFITLFSSSNGFSSALQTWRCSASSNVLFF